MSPFSHAPASTLSPCLFHAVRATPVLVEVLVGAHGAVKAAMVFCEPVDLRVLSRVLHMSQVQMEVWREEILEKSSFRLLCIRGSHQCHRLSSLSNHLFNKSMKPRRETEGEASL